MDAAAKAAQAEARTKAKTRKPAAKAEVGKPAETSKPLPRTPIEAPRAASLFETPALAAPPTLEGDEDEENLPETSEEDQSIDEGELDDAA